MIGAFDVEHAPRPWQRPQLGHAGFDLTRDFLLSSLVARIDPRRLHAGSDAFAKGSHDAALAEAR